ncbi:xanthine dehydrogenase, putative, partial [Perkinsus marinus ATCC 50983]
MKRAAPHTKSGDAEKLIKYYEDRAIKELRFTVNGMPVHVQNIDPECTLLEWLRASGLCGAKLVCGEGGCGACTVSVFTTDIVTGKPVHRSVNSCLVSVCDVSGCEVTTIEGVKGDDCEAKCDASDSSTRAGACNSRRHGGSRSLRNLG